MKIPLKWNETPKIMKDGERERGEEGKQGLKEKVKRSNDGIKPTHTRFFFQIHEQNICTSSVAPTIYGNDGKASLLHWDLQVQRHQYQVNECEQQAFILIARTCYPDENIMDVFQYKLSYDVLRSQVI